MKKIFTHIWLLPLILICGCNEKKHTPPPVERVALTTDFFRSMEENRSESAVYNGKAIVKRDPSFNHVRFLISIQESNEAIGNAQKHLDKGDLNAACNEVDRAARLYPDNHVLKRTRRKLEQLKNAENYIRQLKQANSAVAISEALENISSGLSLNITPELAEFLVKFEQKERASAAEEQKNTMKALEDASKDADKAKADDKKREDEARRIMEEISEDEAVGKDMREKAGPVPFAPGENVSEKK